MDPILRRKTIRMIKDWGRAGRSVIVSSHILHEIESMTANILLINQGRILAEGNVHQIRDPSTSISRSTSALSRPGRWRASSSATTMC
jgi:ABC-type multidrug transport system ATPase subunit